MTLGHAPHCEVPFSSIENGIDFVVSALDPLASVAINNQFLKDLGVLVGQVVSWMDAPGQSLPEATLPGLAGSVHTDDKPRVSPAELKISATLRGSDAADARSKRDRLITLLRNSPMTVVFPDALQRYLVVDLAGVKAEGVGASFLQNQFPIEISLHAADPYRYDLADRAPQGVAGAAIRCPLGTAPVRPTFTISGPAVNPVLTFSDYAGNVIGSLTLTVTLVAGDVLVVDCNAGSIRKNGVSSPALLTAGDFIQLDPAIHANRDASAWPIVSCSAGVCQVRYRRAWS